jgi:hypothetical protein
LIIVFFSALVWLGIQYLGYLEFVYARWFLAKGTLFRLIDDQIRMATLTKSLLSAKSKEEAFGVVKRACHDLGFTEVSIVPCDAEPSLDPNHCHIQIPLGGDYVLLLAGLVGVNRPIALPQLMAAMRDSFHAKVAPARPTFVLSGEVSGFKSLVSTPDLSARRN